jgi:hypothetical protein
LTDKPPMNDSAFHKKNLLPYVDKRYDTLVSPSDAPQIRTDKQTNGLALTAAILTGVAVISFLLVIPPAISLAFSVAALVTASRRGTSKKLALVSLITSACLFLAGIGVGVALLLSYDAEKEVRQPANYSLDDTTGIAYKITPDGQILCDEEGSCKAVISLLATEDRCADGGDMIQQVFSTTTGIPGVGTATLPALEQGEFADVEIVFDSPNSDSVLVAYKMKFRCN